MKTKKDFSLNEFFPLLLVALLCAASFAQLKVLAQDGQLSPAAAMIQQQKLAASDGAASDAYGWAVAISGNTAVIGSPLADVNGNANQGAVYVYVQTNDIWLAQAKLVAGDGSANDQFGFTVAIEGDTVVVGARAAAPGQKGAAYVFVRSGATWTQQAKLIGTDSVNGDRFGEAVAISGNTIVVGAVLHNPLGTTLLNEGAAYVFIRTGLTWSQQAKLTASDPQDFNFFGQAVAIDGDTIVTGAIRSNGNVRIGSAYVFTRTGNVWSQQAKLTANDEAYENQFGYAVSLSGDTAIVGAFGAKIGDANYAGAAYVFTRSNNTWSQEAKLTANAADIAPNIAFGGAVSLKSDTLAVGAYGTRIDGKQAQGSVYLFKRNDNQWQPQSRFTANDGAANDFFGLGIALDSNSLIVGTPQKSLSGATTQQPGAAYCLSIAVANDNTPTIQNVQIKGKKLIITGTNFESPTDIYVNGERQKKTANDESNPTTAVIALKSGRFIAPGQTVTVQVKNTNTDKSSSTVMFTRPVE
jgi:hypothetical protein